MASRRQTGVTLVELMIAVAIVAILTAIAYPSYQRYVARTHRDAAAACMSQVAQRLERFYTANMNYTGAPTAALPCQQEGNLNLRYTISVSASTASTYTIQAAPTQLQTSTDALSCGTLSITSAGRRTPTNNDCWR